MKIQLNPGGNLTYQDYASDIWEILEYNRTQHKDIMSELNVQFVIVDGVKSKFVCKFIFQLY